MSARSDFALPVFSFCSFLSVFWAIAVEGWLPTLIEQNPCDLLLGPIVEDQLATISTARHRELRHVHRDQTSLMRPLATIRNYGEPNFFPPAFGTVPRERSTGGLLGAGAGLRFRHHAHSQCEWSDRSDHHPQERFRCRGACRRPT